jgi:Lamin Tail Domain
MIRTSLLFALASTAACSFGDDRPLGAPGGDADGGPDAKPDGQPSTETGHLLITEVKTSGDVNEFVEIWNPTDRTIDLRNYYLTDVGDYWQYPSGTLPDVGAADFIVRFPEGAMLSPNGVITVASEYQRFQNDYDQVATYGLDVTTVIPDGAKMLDRVRVPGAAGQASITDPGEPVVLFYWDGASDLVKDVDIVIAGYAPDERTRNVLMAKMPVDGPDADTTATAFKADRMQLGVMPNRAEDVTTYKRVKLETGNELQSANGNGINGDDETSEMQTMTWDGNAPMPATPGVVAASLK